MLKDINNDARNEIEDQIQILKFQMQVIIISLLKSAAANLVQAGRI